MLGLPEGDLQAMVVLRADGQAGLRIFREANQIADAHLGAAKAVPPKLDKGAPAAALAIRGLHHLIQVAQKAGNARDVQDAPQSGSMSQSCPGCAQRAACRHWPRLGRGSGKPPQAVRDWRAPRSSGQGGESPRAARAGRCARRSGCARSGAPWRCAFRRRRNPVDNAP